MADLYPAELSGGMQKRVGLARAIAAEPEIIFFDEPTTGLDPIMAGVINDLIREIVTEMGATAMTITHDMSSVRAIADRVAMLHAGVIRWTGPVAEMDANGDPLSSNSSTAAPKARSRPFVRRNFANRCPCVDVTPRSGRDLHYNLRGNRKMFAVLCNRCAREARQWHRQLFPFYVLLFMFLLTCLPPAGLLIHSVAPLALASS